MLESISIDARRSLVIPGDAAQTISYAAAHWKDVCLESVRSHGAFYVALSGGSTPKAIFEILTKPPLQSEIPWEKVHLFWSDERCVAPDHPDSNYQMAMEAGFKQVPIPASQIHRMPADADNIIESAKKYEAEIQSSLGERPFDLIMLGMGDDGHTASLFPQTTALKEDKHLVAANHIPQKETWRMTMTYPCINSARHIAVYVIGASKSAMVANILRGPYEPLEWPSQKIGAPRNRAFWIADTSAASKIN